MIFLRLRCIFLLLFYSIVIAASAKAGTITGTIVDEVSNEPLPGARIAVVGKHTGAISGFDGSYKLKLDPGNYSLKITYVGYLDSVMTITVTDGSQTLDIALERNVKEVTVSGNAENGSDASAIVAVKQSDMEINAVSARTIEVSPDLDVADVAQRLSAVSVTRDAAGSAQYAIIRGMDKRYDYTTVDGVKIPSPNDNDRYVPLDIFPSELLDRLEVSKTLTPEMEGDAIGGAINLVMKQASDGFIANVSVGSGYDGLYFSNKFTSFDFTSASESPRVANGNDYRAQLSDFPMSSWIFQSITPKPNEYATATIGNRFGEDKNFGIILSGSYQNIATGATGTFFGAKVNDSNQAYLSDITSRTYSTYQTRDGAMMNADYEIDESNKLNLFGMLVGLRKEELRVQSDTGLENSWTGPGTGSVSYEQRSTLEEQTIGNVTLSGDDILFGKDLQANWKLVYSKATYNEPDQAALEITTGIIPDSNGGKPVQQPNLLDAHSGSTRTWSSNTDDDKSAYLTLKTTENLFGTPTEFSYGGMYRAKDRTSSYDQYTLTPNSGEVYDGNILDNTFVVSNPLGSGGANALDYTAHEDVTAGFLQAKFQIGKLLTLGGLRAENTDYGWITGLPANTTLSGRTGELSYLDLLPSISFKYDATENQDYRLSYYRAISRPQFLEVIPYIIQGDDYNEEGNPSLVRTQADNYDARWEFFPGGLDQLIAGIFYKNIYDPIEYALQIQSGNKYLIPENYGTATNYGLEVDLTKYFSNFGVRANYTYTHSSIVTQKLENFVNSSGVSDSRQVQQTSPLEGQADNVGNLSLLYRDFESGTDAEISAVYTGPSIVDISPYYNNDIWQRGLFQLDLSGEQRIIGTLSVYFKITNLLNTQLEQYIPSPYVNTTPYANVTLQTPGQDLLIRQITIDRTYVLGVRYKF
jgi:Outer membrane protein beta-barrel family/CarboxypepD_reg-like domain/TonB-dependent Receptor Plug Domain